MSRLTLRVTSSIRCSLQRYMPEYGWNTTAGLLHLVQGWLAIVWLEYDRGVVAFGAGVVGDDFHLTLSIDELLYKA